jgi:ankyrin repeat protein
LYHRPFSFFTCPPFTGGSTSTIVPRNFNEQSLTDLVQAIKNKNISLVQKIITYDILESFDATTSIDSDNNTLIHLAAVHNLNTIILDLINKVKHRNCKDNVTENERVEAIQKEQLRIVNAPNNNGATPLHQAVTIDDNPAAISTLISMSAIVNAQNKQGDTPLHLAVQNNNINPATIPLLITEGGKNINATNNEADTPLHLAARYNKNPQVIATLLNYNYLNINAKDNEGRTPLHLAAQYNDNEEIPRLLIQKSSPYEEEFYRSKRR